MHAASVFLCIEHDFVVLCSLMITTSHFIDLDHISLTLFSHLTQHLFQLIQSFFSQESAEDAQSLEAVCQGTSKAMHLMSHVYHNLSDLFCDFTAPGPRRLRAFSPPMRQATTIIQQTIPVQVSVGLIQLLTNLRNKLVLLIVLFLRRELM